MEQAGELDSTSGALSLRLVIIFRLQRTGWMISSAGCVQPGHSVSYRIEHRGRNSVPCARSFSGGGRKESGTIHHAIVSIRRLGSGMSGNDHDRAIGEGLEEAPPCRSRRFRVDAEAAVELRLGALQRRVHDIATQDRGCSLRAHHDADVAGCMPRPRLDPYTVVEGVV